MTTFKQELTPLAKKYKFYYFIDDLNDDEIIDFLASEVFGTKYFKDFTFEEAIQKCKSIGGSLDSMIEESDQRLLFQMLQKHA
jgi:hypothetical protein